MSAQVSVKLSPKASRNAVTGWLGDSLKVAVTAAPERGKANAALEALLAEVLGLPRGAVRVVAGHVQPRKRVEIEGLGPVELRRRLDAALR